ncbi:D-methionine transport system substrate-binding protein [Breznakia sp. PF5-3]|uniref:MetQ/NlpA family ABC transporter substrate-binding protein n=1 Tax=unclassified Breznakia TaxID=2623764 RepID=UPI0024053F59|nr:MULTISPECIES: MetQ/NlpA family ABC transporter substrate-binding protein [unclassified Breznakia]MDF9825009.1 D-methionine transport system substrate-binding protein [Breznakia sp. PM6-1]MDF9835420.1 D-methionine transport system substrate-binding protein [Breznakia sp. PF5-3]MDF9837652.1 D-methionine transport system substrate-binding protein [Breznakia sp. PFB2-8]MDF9859516.1 D-methionine transport system substrate-binding protein [Breznakia sp. PH5-24]
MKKLLGVFIALGLLVGCGGNSGDEAKEELETITIGASASPHAEILESIEEDLKKEGYELDIQVFDDYVQPNLAVDEGEIDANFFQHTPYLEGFNEDNGTEVEAVAKIHFEPIGIYSNDTTEKNEDFSVDDVKDGAVISVPDDPTNEARALQLLAAKGIIEVKKDAGLSATKTDITKNPKNVEILEVKAEGVAATLPDVDYAIINGNYALTNEVDGNLIVSEDKGSEAAQTYANVIAVKKGHGDDKKIKALIKVLTNAKTKKYIEKTYGDLVVAVFD